MNAASGKHSGFSLVELMVVVTIAGIIAAVAVPAYFNYLQRGYIADVTSNITRLASQLESNYLDTRRYNNDSGQCAITLPTNNERFDLSCIITDEPAPGFQLSATSTSRFDDDQTLVFGLNNFGQRTTIVGSNNNTQTHNCWLITKTGSCI